MPLPRGGQRLGTRQRTQLAGAAAAAARRCDAASSHAAGDAGNNTTGAQTNQSRDDPWPWPGRAGWRQRPRQAAVHPTMRSALAPALRPPSGPQSSVATGAGGTRGCRGPLGGHAQGPQGVPRAAGWRLGNLAGQGRPFACWAARTCAGSPAAGRRLDDVVQGALLDDPEARAAAAPGVGGRAVAHELQIDRAGACRGRREAGARGSGHALTRSGVGGGGGWCQRSPHRQHPQPSPQRSPSARAVQAWRRTGAWAAARMQATTQPSRRGRAKQAGQSKVRGPAHRPGRRSTAMRAAGPGGAAGAAGRRRPPG